MKQVCSGQDAGFEAAIHILCDVCHPRWNPKNLNWNATRKDVYIVAQLRTRVAKLYLKSYESWWKSEADLGLAKLVRMAILFLNTPHYEFGSNRWISY